MKITVFLGSSILALILLLIGMQIGFNTNRIRYIGASTYHSFAEHHTAIGDSELQFTTYPMEIYYSQGGDTGSEVKEATSIFTATGVLLTPVELTTAESDGSITLDSDLISFRFHATVAKTEQGVIYSSSIIVVNPDGGSIGLDDDEISFVVGPNGSQEVLKKVAKTILENL